ncbi:MAG: Fe-S cluster assembly protein NifU [Candidatus Riflebacteria bacterium]|nr:Fe-S cluster assembly protein NifU [Candidatus Riflebacteria bacterium]
MWDYTKSVIDHFENPRNVGKLEDANGVGQVGSLACGDALKLFLRINPETEVIEDAKFMTFGCASAIASASALTEIVKGMTITEALKVTNEQIADYLGGLPQQKMHCSVMGKEALHAAIANYRGIDVAEEHKDEKIVCECFWVSEEKIREVVKEHGLKTVEEVTNYTKAGGKCGKCHNEIKRIIAEVNGTKLEEVPQKPKMSNLMRMKMVTACIEEKIAPMLKRDGGDIELVDMEGADVYVKLHGACSSCVHAIDTLRSVVQETLRQEVSADINVIEAK